MPASIKAITQVIQSHLDTGAMLQIRDDSALHHGHLEQDPKAVVTHIAINLVWQEFAGLSLLQRQRMVNAWLDDFFKIGLHAVSYNLKTPDEAGKI